MQYVEGAECLRPGDEDWTQISDLEAATFTNCPREDRFGIND